MRRGFSSVLVVGMIFAAAFAALNVSVLAKPGEVTTAPSIVTAESMEWTFMVYLDADNDLETYGFANLVDMEAVGSTDKVNIVVLIDTWTTFPGETHWLNIDEADEGISHINLESPDISCDCSMFCGDEGCPGEMNMGDGATLTYFVVNAVAAYPESDYYVLVLWDHGGGWRGVCWDDSSVLSDGRYDRLTTPETATAIEEANSDLSTLLGREFKLSMLIYDACLNGVIDVVYEDRFVADYLVASMTLVPAYGLAYFDALDALTKNPGMTVKEFGIVVVDTFVEQYSYCSGNGIGSWAGDVGMALIDMSYVPALGAAFDALCDALYPDYVDDYRFRGAIESSESQTPQPIDGGESQAYTDLGLFATQLAWKIPELSEEATAVAGLVDQAVEYCRYVVTATGAAIRTTGISLYFTACYYYVWLDYAYDLDTPAPETEIVYFGHDLTNDTLWDEILMKFVMAIVPGEPTVPIA